MERRVLLAYSGDLISSVALAWLLEQGGEVATVTLDLGQGRDLNDVRDRALGIGAARAHVLDVRDVFARDGVAPAWRRPLDEPRAPALARPFIARHAVEIARIEGSTAVAHGSAFPADDRSGLEAALREVGLDLPVLAPARDWSMTPAELLDFARARGIPAPPSGQAARLEVRTLWGRAVTSPELDAPDVEPPADLFTLTRSAADWPTEASIVDVTVTDGMPSALNGVGMSLADLIGSIDVIAGAHGIGRRDYPAQAGRRPRTIEEAPASVLLHDAFDLMAANDGTVRATCFRGEVSFEQRGH